jgi:uncharacterized protein YutE (UPF0331/DUF86 family)
MSSRWSPANIIVLFFGLLISVSAITVAIGFSNHAVKLNENQVLYIFSTSAQVLAGVYGLTLTGFIFFRNELSREEFEDETLADAVESLKQRYFSLLLFITALVMVTILSANLVIANEASGNVRTNTFLINVCQSAFASSLAAIAYFIFDVISPQRIELASKTLQEKVDPLHATREKGSLEEFLRNYNQIEMVLLDAASETYPAMLVEHTSSEKIRKRTSNARLAEILFRNERIDRSLFEKLKVLITLRNSIIHGADPVVSNEIVKTSFAVLAELRLVLATYQAI